MNARPRKSLLAMLRRPLFLALLCSLVLHLPLLALMSRTQTVQPVLPDLSVRLAGDSEPAAGAQSIGFGQPELQADVAESVDSQSWQAAPSDSGLGGAGLRDADVPAVIVAGADTVADRGPAPEPPASAQAAPAQAIPSQTASLPLNPVLPAPAPTPAIAVTRGESAADLAVNPPQRADPPAPQVMVMADEDTRQLQTALHALAEYLGDIPAGVTATADISADMLGLPASDVITVVTAAPADLSALQRVDVTVTRRINGQLYQMRARLQERALSHYAKFINRWDDNVMLSNDTVDGRFHANSAVSFDSAPGSRPQFNGEVTLASRQSVSARLRNSSMFAGGLQTGTGRIALPQQALPGHWLDGNTSLVHVGRDSVLQFNGDAGIAWTDLDTDVTTNISVPDEGLIIVGADRARIALSGIVAGKVLVYSPRQILINGSVVYRDNSPSSPDTLALLSDGSIEVAAASVTGDGDLVLHGALFARQRFAVRRFREPHQGTLHIFGALVAGSVSATEPRFNTRIEHDTRFEHSRPPAFPSAGLFDLIAWEKSWTEVSGSDSLLADAADSVAPEAP